MRTLHRLAALTGVVASLVLVYLVGWRPWILSWGASEAEQHRRLPGDEILGAAAVEHTRAITIDAPVEHVWPWVAQLGQDRGGFYSYELLEDLVGTQMTNADRILRDRQSWSPGDKLWMYPPGKLDDVGGVPLGAHVPGRVIAFATRNVFTPTDRPHDGSWSFVLEPEGPLRTRFLVRSRSVTAPPGGWAVFDVFGFQPMHFIMESKMMRGIAARAEGFTPSSYVADAVEVGSWTAVLVLTVIAAIAALRRVQWLGPLVCAGAGGLAFQVLTLTQPGPVIGVLAGVGLVGGLWWLPRFRRAP